MEINSKKALLILQRDFARFIRVPLVNKQHKNNVKVAKKHIAQSINLKPEERLNIYREQYWWRLESAFDDDFKSLKLVLGELKYVKLRTVYLENYPSTSFTLRDLGQYLEGFIKAHPKYTIPYTKLCSEIVKFEWSKIVSFDSLEIQNLTDTIIQSPRFPSKRLKLESHVVLLDFTFPVHELGREKNDTLALSNTLRKKKDRTKITSKVVISRRKTYLAVYRQNLRVNIIELSKRDFLILTKFKRGISLNALLKLNLLKDPEEVSTLFTGWASKGMLYRT